MDRMRGFTLVELAIALVVASLLAALALPALADAVTRTRASAARGALLGTLTTAIAHAASTGTDVVLCPAAGPACDDSFDWSRGWIAYADLDGNRRRAGAETLVARGEALHRDVRLLSTRGRKRLVIHPTGGNAGSNATFTLCDRRGDGAAATLVLANNGRLRAGVPSTAAAQACMDALRRGD